MAGRLYLCATPIGNLGDVTRRLVETLGSVDVVYAEDTRHTSKLLSALEISVPTRSFFTGNEGQRSAQLAADLAIGKTVALVTDAGTPAISDPGTRAVAAARQAGAAVTVIPGPSAVTAAAAASGLVEGPFVFEGFLARKGPARRAQLAALAAEPRPTILFLSPHRVLRDLTDLVSACGPGRQVCVARELTKLHEELWWGSLAEAVDRWTQVAPRGEFTVVVSGAPELESDEAGALALAQQLLEEGMTPSQAAREAAAETGANRRLLYEQIVNS